MKVFLEATQKHILPAYVEHINNWKNLTSVPNEEKLERGTGWLLYAGLDRETFELIRKQFKFVNQWFFISITKHIVREGFGLPDTLKMARGKFVPWSEAQKWYSLEYIH